MRRWVPVFFIFVFMAAPIRGGTLKVADIHKFWAESGISAEMVRARISNSRCVSSMDTFRACREAVAAAKNEIQNPEFQWPADDFDAVIDQIDNLPLGDKSKEWIFGLLLNTFVQGFDAHASFMPKEALQALVGPDAGVRYGAGIRIMATDAGLFVRSVTANSPAEAAGLKPGDRFVTINGLPVGTGLEGQKNSELIKGEPGDTVDLQIERRGTQRQVKLVVGVVAEKNIESEIVVFNGRRYAYIRYLQFKEESCGKLKSEIGDLPKGVSGLILDLRDNPGGVLEQGICVAGLFVGKKDIVGKKTVPLKFPMSVSHVPEVNGLIDWTHSYRSAAFPDLPLVILINQNSASAAEVVAGALQDYKQAWVVGDSSFGKGSVQTLEPMPSNSRFYIGYTTALFYRPNGNTNQLAGVTPNFQVPWRRQATAAERRGPREGDIYPNSLKPLESSMPWTETRPEVEPLRRCVESTAVDLTASEMITKKTGTEDYQKAYALGLFDCSRKISAQHNSSSGTKDFAKK